MTKKQEKNLQFVKKFLLHFLEKFVVLSQGSIHPSLLCSLCPCLTLAIGPLSALKLSKQWRLKSTKLKSKDEGID